MNREQVKKILDILKLNYPNYINDNNKGIMLEEWCNELKDYSYNEVVERLKVVMVEEKYQLKPPTLYYITSTIPKKNNGIDWSKMTFLCSNCGKAFNKLEELNEHKLIENSVEYVIREFKKWFNKDLSKAELYKMPKSEFKERYNKLLHYIYENTKDENEKTRIGYIFNPPTYEEAQTFINKTI